MDIRKIKKLIELVTESGIAELEITEAEGAIKIKNQPNSALRVTPQSVQTSTDDQLQEPEFGSKQVSVDDANVVVSPMVGTFYLAPEPNAEPVVAIGDSVEVGDTLCIIEAMKMMNQIQAKYAGTVADILLQSGDGVEFDQPLMIITPRQ
ncbi:acetyl-CoA carboxylase biotin carboxyl carrier protein [Shewanella sp. Scap07]|uniref:acetyl-CoA carboxylase biotin carboxyl carrier protein n=1 Tax=Shewanella sp. Scap07 TaxID=2589987 RepID=UPI0015BF0E92|nr:acetyl-CoA carboxylase biotin carboxyl carrier protein [Shewanella sp. Scap07]QLE84083.1 acetyl-CoA carboxylase biotin carboxyl carrier protein [Shewanella sp. Scap07]